MKTPEQSPISIREFLGAVLRRLLARRKWWLIPLWLVLVALGLLLMLGGGPNLLPAIYIAF